MCKKLEMYLCYLIQEELRRQERHPLPDFRIMDVDVHILASLSLSGIIGVEG